MTRVVRFWDPLYYRTYPDNVGDPAGYWSVESEVKRNLENDDDYKTVPADAPDYKLKTKGTVRDTLDDARPAWVVKDGNYVSARWPGDVHTFANTFIAMFNE